MTAPRTHEIYCFGPFRLDVTERLLARDGSAVVLRAKVFDTLVALVRRAGRLVTREALIQAVWPDAIVEEGNLSHNVSALRKALGDDGGELFVATVPRSGYRFVHPLVDATTTEQHDAGDLARARRFRDQGAWSDAYEAYVAARSANGFGAGDREGLAEAARWCGRFDEVVPLLEDAAQAWVAEGDPIRAANVSIDLAGVLLDRRRVALAKSYARQAERRLPPQPPASGPALSAHSRLRRLRARFCWCDADWEGALACAREALEMGRAAEDADAEALAAIDIVHSLLALERFDEVLATLDETGAHVTSGRLGAYASGMSLCGMIIAWQALGRPERALEWSQMSSDWADATGVAYFPGLCRMHRGELNAMRGEFAHAEADFLRGAEELGRAHSSLSGLALRELGTVRLRRGDLAGAEAAFSRALQLGTDPQPGYALLRAARGETLQARRDLERFLSREGNGELNLLDRQNRLGVLGAHVRLALATSSHEAARATVETMSVIANATGSTTHGAMVEAARGELALARGDTSEALVHFTAGWRAWNELGAPYEAACVRVRLAEALFAEGDATRARLELQGAAASFEELGAELDAKLARKRLGRLDTGAAAERKKVRVRGSIGRADALRELLGPDAWRDLVAWLERKLHRCWSDHGGRALAQDDGSYVVEFDDRADAEACVAFVRDSLREHRAQQGFAPDLVVEWSDSSAASPADDVGPGAFTRRLPIERE
jgi:DNA-binding winged helix-turn-helix (wHTH) protein